MPHLYTILLVFSSCLYCFFFRFLKHRLLLYIFTLRSVCTVHWLLYTDQHKYTWKYTYITYERIFFCFVLKNGFFFCCATCFILFGEAHEQWIKCLLCILLLLLLRLFFQINRIRIVVWKYRIPFALDMCMCGGCFFFFSFVLEMCV